MCFRSNRTDQVRDSPATEISQNDAFIVFLDAASDGNEEELTKCYEEAASKKVSLMDRGQPTLQMKLLEFYDGDGNTALHFGCKNGNLDICTFILNESNNNGKDFLNRVIEFRNKRGHTPLMEVCFKGYMQGEKEIALESRYRIVKELLNKGADPNAFKTETKMSPLHWAAFNNDP